jgi:hypothetical protein
MFTGDVLVDRQMAALTYGSRRILVLTHPPSGRKSRQGIFFLILDYNKNILYTRADIDYTT